MLGADYYVHNIDPEIIHLWGQFGLRYYGLAYALGFIIAIIIMRRLHKKGLLSLNPEQQSTALFALILGVMIGGRLGHMLLYDLNGFLSNPLTFFEIWKGGMASHGGFAGVLVACWWIAKKYKIGFWKLSDVLATMTPPGLMLGRIANFINGELWGKPTDVSWAVIFPQSAPYGTPIDLIPARHPSQLYEAALEGLLLVIYTQWRMWKTKAPLTPGRLCGEFLILYAIVRIIGEQFREPDASLIMGVNPGIFYSFFIVLLGAVFIYFSIRNAAQKKAH
ncbi:MAG: prolipoprotein diacylglyceryl transferase [candidate division Zixibacteria bacterium]|nr:prolipoprotein diacylglyceryl transferase [candidate division Zixibacteria bacterium]